MATSPDISPTTTHESPARGKRRAPPRLNFASLQQPSFDDSEQHNRNVSLSSHSEVAGGFTKQKIQGREQGHILDLESSGSNHHSDSLPKLKRATTSHDLNQVELKSYGSSPIPSAARGQAGNTSDNNYSTLSSDEVEASPRTNQVSLKARRGSKDESPKSFRFTHMRHRHSTATHPSPLSGRSSSQEQGRSEASSDTQDVYPTSSTNFTISTVEQKKSGMHDHETLPMHTVPYRPSSTMRRKSRLRQAFDVLLTPRDDLGPVVMVTSAGAVSTQGPSDYFGSASSAITEAKDEDAEPNAPLQGFHLSASPLQSRSAKGRGRLQDNPMISPGTVVQLSATALEEDSDDDLEAVKRIILRSSGPLTDSSIVLAPNASRTFGQDKDWFRQRIDETIGEEDEEGPEDEFELSIPQHLPTSPLCPMHPKYKGKAKVCVLHGRRKSNHDQQTWQNFL